MPKNLLEVLIIYEFNLYSQRKIYGKNAFMIFRCDQVELMSQVNTKYFLNIP